MRTFKVGSFASVLLIFLAITYHSEAEEKKEQNFITDGDYTFEMIIKIPVTVSVKNNKISIKAKDEAKSLSGTINGDEISMGMIDLNYKGNITLLKNCT